MRIRVCVVGRPRDPALATAIAEYEKRAARYWPLDIREVKASSGSNGDTVRQQEGARLLDAAADAVRIICDEKGKARSSPEFAQWLQSLREQARDVAFLIGGAYGLSDELRRGAQHAVALAPWTLPHELARLVLAEQLYRAGTILKKEPYHK